MRSRRLGVSLGINLQPQRSKLCSFDCPYCSCGFNTPRAAGSRWPSPDEVVHSVTRALARLPAPPDCITFSGNGEPTLHPRFAVVVDRVLLARAAAAPEVRVGILSNGLTAGHKPVREALMRLDQRIMKFDPGPMEQVNGVRHDVDRLVDDYRGLKPYTVQAMVVKGRDWDGSSEVSVASWLPRLARAEPDVVQLSSLARRPADASVLNVPRERLDEMAIAIRKALPQCRVEVF
ncbi:MAG TPA: radical SAM protein [Gemmatimonadales bacterium]|nr:radical SAM protein [Gemmatimonadales bacterium]